jgi:type IV pilus assembly protein PilM
VAVRRANPLRRMVQWLDSMPHPATVLEIAETHVAAARWGRGGSLEGHAFEELPVGALAPSAVETNVVNAEAVQRAVAAVVSRIPQRGQEAALLVPDAVVRVFILPFETFPRRADEANPLLRWRLKKSVPFDVEETVISSMRQTGKDGSLEIVAGVARHRVVREYEALAEAAGLAPGVVLSGVIASLALLDDEGATLYVRLSGKYVTSVVTNAGRLCVYRSNAMPAGIAGLDPQALLEEVFPAVAYYQETWGGNVDRARLAGFGGRVDEFSEFLGRELNCPALPLLGSNGGRPLPQRAREMAAQELEGMVGWAAASEE